MTYPTTREEFQAVIDGLLADDATATLRAIAILEALRDAVKTQPVLPGVPYVTTATIHDGGHEYGSEVHFLARDGQDPFELADTIACYELASGDEDEIGCLPEGWKERWEERGDYRLCEAEHTRAIEPSEFPSYDLTPSSRRIRWVRAARDGANFDPKEIRGSVKPVNVLAIGNGQKMLKRVYVSTFIPDDDAGTLATRYVRDQMKIGYGNGETVALLDEDYWDRKRFGF